MGLGERKWNPTVEDSSVPTLVIHKELVIQFVLGTQLRLLADLVRIPRWTELPAGTVFPVYDYTPVPGRVPGMKWVVRKHLFSE